MYVLYCVNVPELNFVRITFICVLTTISMAKCTYFFNNPKKSHQTMETEQNLRTD